MCVFLKPYFRQWKTIFFLLLLRSAINIKYICHIWFIQCHRAHDIKHEKLNLISYVYLLTYFYAKKKIVLYNHSCINCCTAKRSVFSSPTCLTETLKLTYYYNMQ